MFFVRFRDVYDDEFSFTTRANRLARELREDRADETTQAEMMREITEMVLPSASEFVHISIGCELKVILQMLYRVFEGIALAPAELRHGDNEFVRLRGAPFAGPP